MISSQILQNTIDELHGITRVDFAVMDTEGNEVATTMQPDFILPQAVVQFADSPGTVRLYRMRIFSRFMMKRRWNLFLYPKAPLRMPICSDG